MLRLFEVDERLDLQPQVSGVLEQPAEPAQPAQLAEPAEPAQPTQPAEPEPRPTGGQVVLFGATPGSPGATSMAINVAFELAVAKHKVCLIDFDFKSPNLLATLGQESITAGLAGAKRLIEQGRFSDEELGRLLMVLNFDGTKLSILPGLGSPANVTQPMSAGLAATLLVAAKTSFDYVVIDLGDLASNPGFSNELLQQADFSFLVCSADPIGVRRYLWLPTALGNEKIIDSTQLIFNRVRESVLGSNPKRQITDVVARLAQAEVCCFVPNDPSSFDQALLEGLPIQLMKKASPARHAIAMLVRQGILNQRSNLDWRIARHG